MKYSETERFSESFKKKYVDAIDRLIALREADGESVRSRQSIFDDIDAHRHALKKMLGWPLAGHEKGELPTPESELLSVEDGYKIYRMSFEFLDGVRIYGIFLKHDGDEKRPFSIVQHGGQGTPERICDFFGDTSNYNDMAMRVFEKGINVFAPQLLLWKVESYGAEYDRPNIDARLKRVGSSIAAVEIFAITRIIDYFEKQDYVDTIGMVGLSYGGFYTLFTHAIDTRIKAAISCSFFNDRKLYSWNDWTWKNSAYLYSDAEICCLSYPRKMWIEVGNNDELFDYTAAEREFARFLDLSKGKENWVEFRVFDGTHEFYKGDEDIDSFVKELKKINNKGAKA